MVNGAFEIQDKGREKFKKFLALHTVEKTLNFLIRRLLPFIRKWERLFSIHPHSLNVQIVNTKVEQNFGRAQII